MRLSFKFQQFFCWAAVIMFLLGLASTVVATNVAHADTSTSSANGDEIIPASSSTSLKAGLVVKDGVSNLYVDSGSRRQYILSESTKTLDGFYSSYVSVSPDNKKVIFITSDQGYLTDVSVWTINLDGSNRQKIATFLGQQMWTVPLAWSPNSSQLAYVLSNKGQLELWTMNADGTAQTKILEQNDSFRPEIFNGQSSNVAGWSSAGDALEYLDRINGKLYTLNLASKSLSATAVNLPRAVNPRVQSPAGCGGALPSPLPSNYLPVPCFNQLSYGDIMQTCGLTIHDAGCALTASAMVADYYGANTNPSSLNSSLGQYACPIYWNHVQSLFPNQITGYSNTGFSYSTLEQDINNGYAPIVFFNYSTTHFVVVTGGSGSSASNYSVNDPDGGSNTKNLQDLINSTGVQPSSIFLYTGSGVKPMLPQGDYNDYTCANGLRGWAWDPKAPNYSILVDMYADGTAPANYVSTTTANVYRSDVASLVSHDNGLHGFLIPIPASLRDGNNHTIHLFAINTDKNGGNPEISDSPTTINCPAVPQGSFDSASCTTIWGWAWDPKAPNVSINVHLYDGSTIVGGYTANVSRPDVASQVSHDNGLHGFSIPVPDSLKDGNIHNLHIYAINTDSNDLNPEIAQSPKTIQCAIPAPSAPNYLALGPIGLNQISISWTNTADNATGIYVERKIGANGTYTRIATLAANVTSYQDTGLSPATTYYYRVQAYNSAGTSDYSNEVIATTPAAKPTAPTNLSALATSYNQINLSWTNNANNATGVSIERKTGANGTYSQITTLAANATSYQDTGLSPATTYYYRIQVYNADGNSDYSNEANATTALLYTYHLPYVANNGAGIGGNFTTNVSLVSMGNAPANFTITYYDNGGNTLATDNDNGGTLAPNTKYNAAGLAAGQSGAATIVSTQPLSIVVSESGTFNGQAIASSYPDINTTTGVGSIIYAPIALNHSYGAFSTGFVLRNTGTSDTTVTIQYYNDFGNATGSQTVAIKAGNTVQVLQSDVAANLPNNFSGWASITSNNGQPLAGIDVETNPSTGFVATVACTATPGKTVNIPVVFQGAFGNFVTGMQLVNPNGTAANVTVTITRKDGTVMQLSPAHASFQMAAHSDKSFFHSTSVFPELLTANGGFVGTAVVTSDQPLLTIVNQTGSVGGVSFNGSFGTLLGGAAQVNMPSVFKNATAYSSGLQIVNTSNIASTATITYYDSNGNKVYQSKLTADDGGPIKPGGSINPYQGTDSNLPDGFSGTAVISADTSGASFVVVGNISNAKIFYTYAEPN